MLIRTVCRTTVGVNAASAAVPNGQTTNDTLPLKGRSGGCGLYIIFCPARVACGNAWIAVALPRVDVSVNGGNNTPARHAVHITVT